MPQLAEPPRGYLFQELLREEPFWMLLACQLVNLTTWEQARPTFYGLYDRHIGPMALAMTEPEDLHDCMRPLGLWRRRSIIVPRFARAWLQGEPREYDEVLRMPGCGKYAADSWAIFVADDLSVEPKDGKLNWYMDRIRQETVDA